MILCNYPFQSFLLIRNKFWCIFTFCWIINQIQSKRNLECRRSSFQREKKYYFLYFFVIQKGKREKKEKKMFFNLFDVSVCFIDFGLMTQQDGRIVKKRIGSRFVEKSKTRKRELENKRKCFIFIKLDCHFDEIRFDRIHPGDVNGITWVMGKTLAISQTENRRENYWTSSNQRKCSGKKSYIFYTKN